jgi:hypothetical protein
MKTLNPTDILSFGKNKGYLLSTVYKFEPTYLEWLVLNTEHIAIDIEAFEKLPKPTPINVGAVSGSDEYKKVMEKGDIIEIILKTDIFNERASVSMLKEIFERNPSNYPEIEFKFSDEAKRVNATKTGLR